MNKKIFLIISLVAFTFFACDQSLSTPDTGETAQTSSSQALQNTVIKQTIAAGTFGENSTSVTFTIYNKQTNEVLAIEEYPIDNASDLTINIDLGTFIENELIGSQYSVKKSDGTVDNTHTSSLDVVQPSSQNTQLSSQTPSSNDDLSSSQELSSTGISSELSSQGEINLSSSLTESPSSEQISSEQPSSSAEISSSEAPRELEQYELFHFDATFPDLSWNDGGCTITECPVIEGSEGEIIWNYDPGTAGWGGIMWTNNWEAVTESPFGDPITGATSITFEAMCPLGGSFKFKSNADPEAEIIIKNMATTWTTYTIAFSDDVNYNSIDMGFAVWPEGAATKAQARDLHIRNIRYSNDPTVTLWIEDFVENFDNGVNSFDSWGGNPTSRFYRENDQARGYGGMDEINSWTGSQDNSYISSNTLYMKTTEQGGNYFSPIIISREQYTYGKFEARIKMPSKNGQMDGAMWPSFWLLGNGDGCNRSDTWPECGEIDILETGGNHPDYVIGSNHWGPNVASKMSYSDTLKTGTPLQQAYHTFTVVWSPNKITTSFDGEVYHEQLLVGHLPNGSPFDNSAYFAHTMEIRLMLTVGAEYQDFYGIHTGIPTAANYPQTMEVDYVARWHRWNDRYNIDNWGQ